MLQYDGLKECHTLERAKRFLFIKRGRREDGERIAGRRKSNVKRWRVFGKTKRGFSNLSIALRDGRRQMKGREIRRAK